MKTIFELTEELLRFNPEEIQTALTTLMLTGKLDFITLNQAYVKSLEVIKEDQDNKLSEANGCIADLFIRFVDGKKETKHTHNTIHRALYNLNQSKQFNIDDYNKQYGYDEEKDKELSTYYRWFKN